jgi:hypothetical protein
MTRSNPQLHHRRPAAAFVLRRFGDGFDVGMLLQGFAEGAHAAAVDLWQEFIVKVGMLRLRNSLRFAKRIVPLSMTNPAFEEDPHAANEASDLSC